jgi:hypothetical protein
MKLPEYVTVEEVKRVCKELNIRDWSSMQEPEVLQEEAIKILSEVNIEGMDIPLDDFLRGLEVELEHGTIFKDANVTNNHPLLTGKIVLAHLKETMDYYKRLEVAELEGDLLKAIIALNLKAICSRQLLLKIQSRFTDTTRNLLKQNAFSLRLKPSSYLKPICLRRLDEDYILQFYATAICLPFLSLCCAKRPY